jgi:transcriptional regulator with XRE-family HTH domain
MPTRKRFPGEEPARPLSPPASREPLPLRSALLLTFRTMLGVSKKDLAELMKVPSRLIGRYESGKEKPPWSVLFAAVMLGERPLFLVHETRYAMLVLRSRSRALVDLDEEYREDTDLRDAARNLFPAERVKQVSDEVCLRAPAPARRRAPSPEEAQIWAVERHAATEIWDALKDQPPWEWHRHPYLKPSRLTSWAEGERLCAESLRLIERLIWDGVESWDPRLRDAEDLAWLALRSACLCSTTAPWKPRLAEYAWAHIGATRGLRGDFPGAEEAFFYVGQHLMENHRLDWGPLEGGVPLFLQALVRFRQGHDKAALALLRHAAQGLEPGHVEASLLEVEILLRTKRPARAVAFLEALLGRSAEPGFSDRRLARRAVRLLAEAAGALLAAGRRSEAENLLDRRADAWAEAAGLSAGVRAQLRLLFRLAREGRLEAARTARMVKELRGLMAPPAKPRSQSIERSYPLYPMLPDFEL